MISDWASEAYRNDQLLSGIIYLHPITHTRMEGSILKNLRTLQSLCGQEALSNVFLTTTQWSRVNWAEGEFRENRLRNRELWGGLIEKGATLQRFIGTRESGLELIHRLMLNKPKPLHIQNQMVKQHMTLLETDAGKCINELLVGQKKKHKEEESLSKEHQEAIKAKEDEMKKNLAVEQAKAQKKLEEAVSERELLVEVKKREAEERERQEEAAAKTKLLEKQLAAEIKKRQEEIKLQEETISETKSVVEGLEGRVREIECARLEEAVAKMELQRNMQELGVKLQRDSQEFSAHWEMRRREAEERKKRRDDAGKAKFFADL